MANRYQKPEGYHVSLRAILTFTKNRNLVEQNDGNEGSRLDITSYETTGKTKLTLVSWPRYCWPSVSRSSMVIWPDR